MKPILAVV